MNIHKCLRFAISMFLVSSGLLVTAYPASAIGVSGIEAYVINSNGVSCGQECVSQSQAQVALCVVSSEARINFVNVTYGYTLRKGSESVSSASYPSAGVTLQSSSTCSGGYLQTWDFRDLIANTEYVVEAWMTNDSITYSTTLTFTTQSLVTTPTTNPLSTSTTVAIETLVPGRPLVEMYEGSRVGTWNLVDDATGQVLTTSVCTPLVCGLQGEWRTWPADRLLNNRYYANGYPERATYYWNPIGAGSGGRYYTNGLYVTSWGQHILPGTSTLVAPVSAPTTIPGSGGDDAESPISDQTTTTSSSTTTSTTVVIALNVSGAPYENNMIARMAPAKISVQLTKGQYRLLITTELANTPFIIKATAPGKPTITWTSATGKLSVKRITSMRSLKGYKLALQIAGSTQSTITVS